MVDGVADALRVAGAIGIVFGAAGRALAVVTRKETIPVGTTPADQRAAIDRLKAERRREQRERDRG